MSTRSTDFLLFIFAFLSRVNKQELGLYEKGLNSPHSLYKLQTLLKTNLCMDALITNFHLPESTLIMLVSAFAGYEFTMDFYNKAVEDKYRFFSFGDAMFIM